MTWSIDRIEKELLSGPVSTIALPSEMLAAAVNQVEQTLGAGWIESEISQVKGLSIAVRVIGMGLRLPAIENLPRAEELIRNLRRRDQNADAELTAIHLFRSMVPSPQLELYPSVGQREADFRIRESAQSHWTTVEVTQPMSSEERQRMDSLLRHLLSAFEKLGNPFSLDILFRREPTDNEVEVLRNRLPEFCQLQGQQQATLVGGLGFLFLNYAEIGRLALLEVAELAETSMIGVTAFFSDPAGGGGPHHQVSIRIPFSDDRAERIIRTEAAQLPKEESGLIMIHESLSPRETPGWVSLIERRFQPRIHTRVGGVCLFSGGMVPIGNQYGWLLQTRLLVNQHAKIQLPGWVKTAITRAGEEFERAFQALSAASTVERARST
jgi:hypothetical protein